jgi:DNA-binding response OmpR family regulator
VRYEEVVKDTTILIVEDDDRTRRLVRTYLEREGYTVIVTDNGDAAVELARSHLPLLVILDLMLPGMSGLEVCRHLRRASNPLIIMLTARTTEEDRIIGLESGADDYISKPFSPRELVARVRAVLRRSVGSDGHPNRTLAFGGLVLDTARKTVTREGEIVVVTPIEFRLLTLFVQNPGVVFSRAQLIDRVFGYDYEGLERTVDAHVKNLRRKIEPDSRVPRYIQTRFGEGYYCRPEDS